MINMTSQQFFELVLNNKEITKQKILTILIKRSLITSRVLKLEMLKSTALEDELESTI